MILHFGSKINISRKKFKIKTQSTIRYSCPQNYKRLYSKTHVCVNQIINYSRMTPVLRKFKIISWVTHI